MAISFQTEAHSTSLDTTTVVTKPTGTTDGDLLIVGVYRSGVDDVNSVPSGWTLIHTDGSGGGEKLWTYYKIASSEGASWTWGWDGSNTNKGWYALRFDGHDATTPIDTNAIATVTNDGTPSFANTVTPTIANCMLVFSVLARQDSSSGTSGYAVTTDNPTWTERLDTTSSSVTCAVATADRTATSATGNSTVTLGSDDGTEDSTGSMIVIRRKTQFTANPTETITASDTLTPNIDYVVNPTETMTMTENLSTADPFTTWTNVSKNTTTWTNQS